MYQRVSDQFYPDSNSRNVTRPRRDLARASFDREYVHRLQNKDPETERHFVDYFGKLLRIKLYARLRNAQMVEDLTQETFLRVLTALRREDGIKSPSALGAYVNSICNNLLFELNRGKSRADCVSIDDLDPPDKRVSAESTMVSEESKELVRRTLQELPWKDRELLRMVFYEETDRGDICRNFRISPDYLRVLVHRAKARFREYWLERYGEAFPTGAITGESIQETRVTRL
jgi:RNA polymerase sigma-70 factor, ECF subfamily